MNLDDAVHALIPVAEVSEDRRELVRELALSRDDETRVLFELVCLHVLAVHFGIVQVFAEEPPHLARFIEAYHRYWTTYSAAVAVNYSEAGNLAALGAHAFIRIVEQTASMLASWDELGEIQDLLRFHIELPAGRVTRAHPASLWTETWIQIS